MHVLFALFAHQIFLITDDLCHITAFMLLLSLDGVGDIALCISCM